jgi:hypothetical protein
MRLKCVSCVWRTLLLRRMGVKKMLITGACAAPPALPFLCCGRVPRSGVPGFGTTRPGFGGRCEPGRSELRQISGTSLAQ